MCVSVEVSPLVETFLYCHHNTSKAPYWWPQLNGPICCYGNSNIMFEIIQTQLFKIKLANIKSAYSTSPYLSCGNYHKGSWLNFPHSLSLLADHGASLYGPASHFQGPVRWQKFFLCDRCFHVCVFYQTWLRQISGTVLQQWFVASKEKKETVDQKHKYS